MATRPPSASNRPVGARQVGRPAGPTAQGSASRQRIMDAATGVFARLGYDRARMTDIVTASGLTKGAVYFHFTSKEALAVAVLTRKQESWIARVRNGLAAEPAGRPRLRALLPIMVTIHREDPDAWVVARLTSHLAQVDETRDLAAELSRRWVDVVADLIVEIQDETGDRDVDPSIMATVIVAGFDGLKQTVDVLNPRDRARAQSDLGEGGALIERMVLTLLERP